MNGRLGRIRDRRRVIQRRVQDQSAHAHRADPRQGTDLLVAAAPSTSRFFAEALSALLVCAGGDRAFVGTLLHVELAVAVAPPLHPPPLALIVGLGLFRERSATAVQAQTHWEPRGDSDSPAPVGNALAGARPSGSDEPSTPQQARPPATGPPPSVRLVPVVARRPRPAAALTGLPPPGHQPRKVLADGRHLVVRHLSTSSSCTCRISRDFTPGRLEPVGYRDHRQFDEIGGGAPHRAR